jgi:hypothetical protein
MAIEGASPGHAVGLYTGANTKAVAAKGRRNAKKAVE